MSAKVRLVNQNWWFTTLMVNEHKYCPPLTKDIKCDVLIVGGGFSGVSAAAEFLRKGLSVVLIEKNIIGGSSSGRSAGFLTPDSELELHQLVRRYGTKAAAEIWEAPLPGHRPHRRSHPEVRYPVRLLRQDSLFLGLGEGGKEAVAVRAGMPAKASASPISAPTTNAAERHSRRAGIHRRHPLWRHLRDQSIAVPAGVEGPADRERHAGVRKHRDGAAGGSHGLHACAAASLPTTSSSPSTS